ncbi:outer membrane receptor protein involved in Fe transport [Flavobacterium sp. CG_23.5]|uniref:TonB-dependent receptor plug domain-containing protein n=1 Tax=Flavobacterium sp. CG_23.5 TaxID=2760708 RepID=UPI001AE16387|nr:TonB-dependent receptor [Flavobacterium sp. CG_23.5]MBP2284737.1 outer membrane receptor protein involved in Fe transport [Flavobacterium sp. CG_23.5]
MKQFYIWAVLFVSTIAMAQQDLTVSVIDAATQKPVSNLSIVLVNKSRNLHLIQSSNIQGKVIFRNLEALDGYQIISEGSQDFAAQSSDFISIRSNQNPNVTLILRKRNAQQLDEVVISTGSTSKINRRDAEVSSELKAAEIQEIPVEGRDITRVLYRLPNVSQATGFYPEAPNVSINGINGLFTSYLIDGLDNNERFLGGQKFAIPSGFVKDITVLTSNFSAEYGLTGSGIIDITPRSGSNELRGEAFFITRPGPTIDGHSSFAQRDLSGNQVKDGFARYQAGGGVGGAFVKDKTFYYFNFEHTTDIKDNLLNVPALGVNETVRGTNTFNYFSSKIDQNWNKNFRSSIRANVGLVDIERQGGGLEGGVAFPSSANTQKRNSVLLALKNSYSFGKISGETNIQYSHFNWDYANPQNVKDPQVVVLGTNDETLAVLGHPGYLFKAVENTVQIQQKIKYYLDNHTLKGGLNYIRGNHDLFGGGNPNGNYTVKLTQSQIDAINNSGVGSSLSFDDIPSNATVVNYNVELRPASFGTHQDIYSAYVEDLWSATEKLNITLGLRYDYDNLSKGGSNKGDNNNLAPRFNFNYKLTNNSSFRGGYGIAYDKINYAIYSDALQQNTKSADYRKQLQQFITLGILPANTNLDAITFNGNISASEPNVTYLQGPSGDQLQAQREGVFSNERRILNPNGYNNPYSQQFSLGYQLQVDENKLFFVDLVHNRGENLFRLRNLNAAAEYTVDPNNVIVRTPSQADATRPIPISNGVATINGQTVTGVARNVVISETEGKSRYYAMSLNYQKARGEDKYSYRLNYTLSSLKNDTEDINFRAMDGNNYGNEWGPSINDRTHNINGIYSYYPFTATTLTLAGLLQSGQPINRIPLGFGTTDLNGDGSGFSDAYQGNSDRYPGETRNSDRLPWSTTFDIGLQHQFKISGNNKIELRADIFNLFNAENLSGYSNNATQSNQIQGGSMASGLFTKRNASPPRQFQFGVRYLF